MASSIVARGVSSVNGASLLSVGQVCSKYGCHPNSIRNWCNDGSLPCITLPSGHRRVTLESAMFFFEGVSPEDLEKEGNLTNSEIGVYARVSSESQDKAGSLNRQLERLLSEVATREAISPDSIQVFKDVASSFGARVGLDKLVDAMLEGTVKTVYVEHFNRYSRVPALSRLLEHIAERSGVRVVALDIEDEDKDSLQADVRELVDFVQVIANRSAARKSRLVTVKNIPADAIQRAIALREAGESVDAIARILEGEGYRTSKNDPISAGLLRKKLFDGNGLETITTKVVNPTAKRPSKSAFKKWVGEHLVASQETDRLPIKSVLEAYSVHANANGLKTPNSVQAGIALRSVKRVKSNGQRILVGVKLA